MMVRLTTRFAGNTNRSAFRRGTLTNIFNPKVTLFFLAFMPQFIAPESSTKFLAFVVLGCCFIFTGTAWCLTLVFCASRFTKRLRASEKLTVAPNRAAGSLFVLLGLRLATAAK